jgi:hypothetical protein
MNDHHFSYPVVIPLRGVTISGHSSLALGPVGSLQATAPVQPLGPHAPDAALAPRSAFAALAA